MTREEAIEIIEDLIADVIRTTAEENKALDLAISALQAEPSVSIQPKTIANNYDLISRAEAVKAIKNRAEKDNKLVDEWFINTLIDDINELPSVSAERVGEWEQCENKGIYQCSYCHKLSCCDSDYCSNCGARMENTK